MQRMYNAYVRGSDKRTLVTGLNDANEAKKRTKTAKTNRTREEGSEDVTKKEKEADLAQEHRNEEGIARKMTPTNKV